MREQEGIPSIQEFEDIILERVYPLSARAESLPMTPQQLSLAHHSINSRHDNEFMFVNQFSKDYIQTVDVAQHLGLIPQVSPATRAAAFLLGREVPVSALKDYGWRIIPKNVALYNYAPLSAEKEEDRLGYINAVEKILSLEEQFSVIPGFFTQEDSSEYQLRCDEAWQAACSYVGDGKLDRSSSFIISTPRPGKDRITWGNRLTRSADSYLSDARESTHDLMEILDHWNNYRHCIKGSRTEQGLTATIEKLRDEHGEEPVANLLEIAERMDYDNELFEHFPKALAPHATTMTWENLLTFARLVKEYNLEWAVAAMEWSEAGEGEHGE